MNLSKLAAIIIWTALAIGLFFSDINFNQLQAASFVFAGTLAGIFYTAGKVENNEPL